MTEGHTENGDLENHGNASYLKILEFSGQAQESRKQSGHLP